MHFHNPAVPIFDSLASGALCSLVRWSNDMAVFGMPRSADEWYGWYVMRFLSLYEKLTAAGLKPTVRRIDYYLLSLAGSS
jgi:hypothetical protein